MKHILLSNDDGYSALGLEALAERLKTFAKVTVIAPEVNHSGASNSLTLSRPMFVHQSKNGFYYVNGTPSDCVHLALTSLLSSPPDLVVSGINNGANLGEDTLYSGTVAAATEGFLFGIPAIALSLTQKGWPNLTKVADIAAELVKSALDNPVSDVLMNINFPVKDTYSVEDVEITRLGRRHPSEPAQETYHPSGERMYWIGPCGQIKDSQEGTDFYAINQGKISLTPLKIDLTNNEKMTQMRDWKKSICKKG
ncbi:5'/3'-nucleotidase SurE [Basilea psittacipulmonis]|uniref:5'-nucleotidase SurE n=1 Tax=Basilea psittacipulmonis DSM 24701 TaxID=1072685 RepID=A0A077DH88_9BURK|nr:5'/3'-nucleotidase SurE [Basilea psittacipulmonis]AIL32837.1 stationary phase survival protein SurE [Basilea psittacipulmonis DSM 24701]